MSSALRGDTLMHNRLIRLLSLPLALGGEELIQFPKSTESFHF